MSISESLKLQLLVLRLYSFRSEALLRAESNYIIRDTSCFETDIFLCILFHPQHLDSSFTVSF